MNKKLETKLNQYFGKAKNLEDLRKRYRHVGSYIMKYDEFDNMDYNDKEAIIATVLDKYINKFYK